MDTSPQISTVSLPSNLADILNRHDLDDEMFMYYLFILKGNDDAIYELTMRRWANIETQTPQNPFESHNLEPQNPIEIQVDDPTIPCTSSTTTTSPNDIHSETVGGDMDDQSSAESSGCSSSNEGVPIGDNAMDGEGYISDSSSLGYYDDPITPGGIYIGPGLEVPENESTPEYDSDGIEIVPGVQLF